MTKKNVVVLYGGCSTEHQISKLSAATVIAGMSQDKYNIIPVYITSEGKWLMYDGSINNIQNIQWEKLGTRAIISPDRSHKGLLRIVGEKVKNIPVDVVFPVLHGASGEDGTIQGLLELAGIPYVGCGVLASAVSMDKAYTKLIVNNLGIGQAMHLVFEDISTDNMDEVTRRIRYEIGYPCFVKPARAGSSVGISKAGNKKELVAALHTALEHDKKVLVEKMVTGRELECAVIGSGGTDTKASGVGEVKAAAEFYDYDAKYNNSESKVVIPADIPEEVAERIKSAAINIFRAVNGSGLARVDFFWDEENDRVIFNEINTMPGFTSISMYPMLLNHMKMENNEIIDVLIDLGLSAGSRMDDTNLD